MFCLQLNVFYTPTFLCTLASVGTSKRRVVISLCFQITIVRDISLLTKVHIIKAIVFSSCHVQLWELGHKKRWVPKKGCFWTVVLRVPGTARRSNKSILKEINPEYSLEGLMLKLQYFGHLIWRVNSLEKTLMLTKIEGRGRSGWQRTRWLDGITDSMNMSLSKLQKIVKDREAWNGAVHGVVKSLTWLSNSTTTLPCQKRWLQMPHVLKVSYPPILSRVSNWEMRSVSFITPFISVMSITRNLDFRILFTHKL